MRLFHDMKSNLYSLIALKCVSITNANIRNENIVDSVIR